ncbi:hypothetical protein A6J40_12640 [Legionella longbeachae]|uniref:hypothetical protein n=1 Tax=Legionella longbeachae TaxID=450 RepID=UPI0009B7874C|nr:hypothetical protein [Legionella longbeachae]ARB92974.1 hypothetical protein A6J40_12640 [Legionella longbeachae]RZV26626.1 hypothetical protein EKG34_05665 [Legionella longbeachae]UAK47133.1 hypothetical protein K8O86_02785 [Legionella longbeachae]VEE04197.1 Uncharacterised protein [Legionella oakridgensis]
MEFYTYLTLEDLHRCRNKIILPIISDFSSENLEYLALEYIKSYEPYQLIEFLSWLNMIVSVKEIEEIKLIQNHLLKKAGWPVFPRHILLHRYNLLSLLGLTLKHIETIKGTVSLSARCLMNSDKFLVALAILNCHPHKEHDFIRQLIRDFPNYNYNHFTKIIYFNRILKSYLLFSHKENKEWNDLLDLFKRENELDIKQLVRSLVGFWQYYSSKFNLNRHQTFFIKDSKFKKFLPAIKYLTSTTAEISKKFHSQDIKLYNVSIETVLRPFILKEEGVRFPMDFLSIINTNGALAFEIFKQCYFSADNGSEAEQYKTFKDKIYSVISEDIFIKIIKRIFTENFEETRNQKGYPDCIVKDNRSIILFEYTTQEPGYLTIFSQDISKVKEKYSSILVKRTSQSSPKAKLQQISKHISLLENKYKGKKIFPILVTDNHFGDFDLLDQMDYFLTHCIYEKSLTNLKENKITFLSMDDIFFIFRYKKMNSISNLTKALLEWNSDFSLKKDYTYSFSAYLASNCKAISKNYRSFCGSAFSYLDIKVSQ